MTIGEPVGALSGPFHAVSVRASSTAVKLRYLSSVLLKREEVVRGLAARRAILLDYPNPASADVNDDCWLCSRPIVDSSRA